MNEKYFLSQIKRATDGTYTKGVVVHDSLNNALNGFHAYFGAYGYEHDANTDYVACFVSDMSGAIIKSEVDDRIVREQPQTNANAESEE